MNTVTVANPGNQTTFQGYSVALQIQGRRSPAFARLMSAASWPGFPPQSRVIPPALALIPDARLATITSAGHHAAGDNPQSTVDVVSGFLIELGW